MLKKTTYRIMAAMIVLTLLLFGVFYFFDLKPKLVSFTSGSKFGEPYFNDYIYGDLNTPLGRPMDVTVINKKVYVSDTKNKRIQVFTADGKPAFIIGKEGSNQGEFLFPYGLTSDDAKNLYVADLYTKKISIFDSQGKFLKYFTVADKNIVLDGVGGIRIVDKKLYVTDINKGKVYEFTLDGKKF